jgi:hypothetical protein
LWKSGQYLAGRVVCYLSSGSRSFHKNRKLFRLEFVNLADK